MHIVGLSLLNFTYVGEFSMVNGPTGVIKYNPFALYMGPLWLSNCVNLVEMHVLGSIRILCFRNIDFIYLVQSIELSYIGVYS
jgi:hypothetical protein